MKTSPILLACFFAIRVHAAPDAAEQFQRALYLYETARDYPAAIVACRALLQDKPMAEIAMQTRLLLAASQLALGKTDDAKPVLEELLTLLRSAPAPGAEKDIAEFDRTLQKLDQSTTPPASRRQLLDATLKGIAGSLGPGGEFMTREPARMVDEEFAGVGAVLSQKDGDVIVIAVTANSPAQAAGVQQGWIVTAIDGETVESLGGKFVAVAKAIRGAAGSPVSLTFRLPSGEDRTIARVRQKLEITNHNRFDSHRVNADGSPRWLADAEAGIVSLWFDVFNPGIAEKVRAAFASQPARGYILDLRGNYGGSLWDAQWVADWFLKECLIVQTRGTDKIRPPDHMAKSGNELPDVPLVVLVNGGTASEAEVVAAALQDYHRATIIGHRTMGRCADRIRMLIDGRIKYSRPISEYLRSNGVNLDRAPGMDVKAVWGVTPDVIVPPVPESIAVEPPPPPGESESDEKITREPDDDLRTLWINTDAAHRDEALAKDVQFQAALDHLKKQLRAPLTFSTDDREEPGETYLRAYLATQDAEKLVAKNSNAEAIQTYQRAIEILTALRTRHPQWKEQMVEARKRHTEEALKRLAPKTEEKKSE